MTAKQVQAKWSASKPRFSGSYPSPRRLTAFFCAAFVLSSVVSGDEPSPPLVLNQEIAGELTAPTSKTFSIDLRVGEVLKVQVEDKGLNLALELKSSTGQSLALSNHHPAWKETIVYEATAAGRYQVIIRTSDFHLSGGYVLRAELHPAATDEDRLTAQAEILSRQAYEQGRSNNGDASEKALATAERAEVLWNKLGNVDEVAFAQLSAANAAHFLSKHEKVLELATQAAAVFQKTGNAGGEESAYRAIGRAYLRMGKGAEATQAYLLGIQFAQQANDVENLPRRYSDLGISYEIVMQVEPAYAALRKSLDLCRKIGASESEAQAMHNLADMLVQQSRYDEAIPYSEGAIAIFRRLNQEYQESVALLTLGQSYQDLGDLEQARDAVNRSLAIRIKRNDVEGTAQAHEYLCDIESSLGQYDKALSDITAAMDIRNKTDFKLGGAIDYLELGEIYTNLGQFDKALAAFETGLRVSRELGARRNEADIDTFMSTLFLVLGQDDRAIECANQALAIYQKDQSEGMLTPLRTLGEVYLRQGERAAAASNFERIVKLAREQKKVDGQIMGLSELAVVQNATGNYTQALAGLKTALALAKQIQAPGMEAEALGRMGAVEGELHHWAASSSAFDQSLALYRRLKSDRDTSAILYSRAKTEKARGNLPEAQRLIEESLALSENLRSQINNNVARTTWFASVQDANSLYVQILMDRDHTEPGKGFDVLAFEAAEHGRARDLLDQLRERSLESGQPADQELSKQEKRLREQIDALEAARFKVLTSRDPSRAAQLDRSAEELHVQLEQLQGQMRRLDPQYAALAHPSPTGLRDIQQQLEEGTLLLEYSLATDHSYVWTIGNHLFHAYQLPPEPEIRRISSDVSNLVTARGQSKVGETPLQRSQRIDAADRSLTTAVGRLSTVILGPVRDQLGLKRLVVVSDGALEYIPFSLLFEPGHPGRPLVLDHELSQMPSASTIAIQRNLLANRPSAPKTLAIFADPVFSPSDDRMPATSNRTHGIQLVKDIQATRLLVHSNEGAGLDSALPNTERVPRLRFTAEEAKRIENFVPADQRLTEIGFAATRANVLNGDLRQYQYIHFATHGWTDNQHPERSALVLSLYDAQGNSENGLIRAGDFYDVGLNAKLVTLSACQTGLGKQIQGEGLVGLTQAFLYAGAARVLVSLWNVNDQETSELMSRFYAGVFERHLSPAAALRAAQLGILRQDQWKAPYYWAAFTLFGDWR